MDDNVFQSLANQERQRATGTSTLVTDSTFDMLADQERKRQQAMAAQLTSAVAVNPDTYNTQRKAAESLGLPPLAAQSIPNITQQAQAQKIQRDVAGNPVLQKAYSSEDFAKLGHDDSGVLATVGQFFVDTGGSAKAGVFNASKGAAGVFRAGLELVAPVLDPLESVTAIGGNPLRRLAEGFAMQADAAGSTAKAAAPKTDGMLSGGFQSGIQSLTQNTLMLPFAFLPGGQPAALAGMVSLTGGQSYQDAREKGLSMSQALPFAASQAAIEYATEKIPLAQLIGDVKAGTNILKTLAKQMALEIPGEQVATVLQDLNEWAVLNPEKPFADYIAERPNAFVQTLIATMVGTGGNVVIAKGVEAATKRLMGDAYDAGQADTGAEQLKAAMLAAANSKLRERNPEEFRTLVQNMASQTEGAPTDVYVDAEVLNQLAPEVLAQLPGVAAQMEAALAANDVVSIPMSDVLTVAPGTPLEAMLVENARIGDPSAMSQAEAKEAGSKAQEFLAQESERVIAQAVDQQAWQASHDAVKQTVLEQLNAVGRFRKEVNEGTATMFAAMYTTIAGERGITPEQAWAEDPITFTDKTGNGAVLNSAVDQTTTPEFQNFFGDSKVVDTEGKPLVVYHGTGESFDTFDINAPKNGVQLYGKGFYFSGESTYASGYARQGNQGGSTSGGNVMPVYLALKNPLTDPEEMAEIRSTVGGFKSAAIAAEIQRRGYDGVAMEVQGKPMYVAFNPAQIKSAIGNNGGFNPNDPNILKQENADLVAQHNLTAANLLHAVKMGGIPVPSLAVTNKAHPLTGFGEITLLAPSEMVDPQGYAASKVFGADIYSPRYPQITYELTPAKLKTLKAQFAEGEKATGATIQLDELEKRGADEMANSAAVMWQFLTEQGVTPNVKTKEGMTPGRLQRLKNFGFEKFFGDTDHQSLMRNDEFQKLVIAEQNDAYIGAGLDDLVVDYEDAKVNDWSRLMALSRNPAYEMAKVGKEAEPDGYATRDALRTQIRGELDTQFAAFVAQKFEALGAKEKIFQGFTDSGNRKYTPHTLENVVKILKKELRGGENFNYGVGSLRAKFTPQFKSLAQIRKAKDRLMDKAAFEAVKTEVDTELEGIADQLGLSLDQAIEVLEDAPKLGAAKAIERALKDYKRSDAPASEEAKVRVAEYLTRLRNLPTEYFEAKILRDVDLAEFKGAVVPEGVDPAVIKALNDRGVTDIRTYTPGSEDDRAAKINEFGHLFFQGPRGTFNPKVFELALNPDANLSTVHHEMAHAYLEILTRIAARPNPPAGLMANLDRFLQWQGIADLDTWNAMSLDQKRPHHEALAEGYEQYLLTGKAPSLELQPLMRKLKAFILNAYTSLKAFFEANPNVEQKLPTEMVQFYDRMLASEEQIKQAEGVAGLLPDEDATAEANEKLTARSLRDLKWSTNALNKEIKALQKQAAELRKGVEAEVRAEIDAMPEFAAKDALAKLKKEGPLADAQMESIAEVYGFTSVDEMLQAIAAVGNKAEVIEGKTDQRMLEEHGDLIDQKAIEQAALEAVHNEARARSLATELRSQAEMLNPRQDTGKTSTNGSKITVNAIVAAAKQFAANVVGRSKVIKLKALAAQHTAAERRAGKRWLEATAAGKTQDAVKAKQDQVLNNAAAKAALEAGNEVAKSIEYLKKFDKESVRKNLPPEYTDQIDKLLERVDLRVSVSGKEIDRRASLAKWIESQNALGIDPIIPEELMENIKLTSYKEMTVDELRDLILTVKHIEHIGRLKSRLLAAKDKREFGIIATEIADAIRANGGTVLPVQLEPDGKIKKFFKGAWADHRKLNSLVHQMDGKDNGFFYRALIAPMNERGTQENVGIEKATEALAKIYAPIEKLPGGISGAKLFIPEIRNSLSRAGRLSVALNWGNAQNRQRIMDGDAWTEAQVNAILATLTPVELQFVNDVWAHIDGYWPDIAAKQLRVSGVVEEKVEAEPFMLTASDGTQVQMRGGYYPIKYDSDRSLKAQKNESKQMAEDIMRGAVLRPTTRRSHTKARVEEVVGRPVRKDLSTITQHVNQVVHDLAWHEWTIDAIRLLNDPRIAGAIREHYGPEIHRAMTDTMEAIAVGNVAQQTSIDTLLLAMRSNVTRSIMGASLTTALMQPFGLTQSMARIGVMPVLKGAARWGGDAMRMENTVRWIQEKSEFMRLRGKTFNRELREISQRVNGKSKVMQIVDTSLFMLMQKMQMVADVPTWVGAYEKALAGGVDDDTAIALADEAVLASQGGGDTKDLSSVQRNLPFLTQFYSYFNTTLQLNIEATVRTDFKNPRAVAGWLGDMALLNVIPAILPALLTYALKGGDDDDPEKWAKRLAGWQASYLLGMFVGLRELPAVWSPFDYQGPPAGKLVNDGKRLVQQAGQGEIDDAAVLATIGFLGTALGLPTTQLVRSYKGWKAWDEGNAPATAVLFGPPPKD
jgi:hypothetical protein